MSDPNQQALQRALGTAYTIERELGGGGMSRVFLAREVGLGRDVVVKVVAPELAEGLSGERFAREVRVAARLQQANIVPMFSAGSANGLAYYTMPFVDGQSLRGRMQRGPLSITEATSILRDVARALAYAHAQGVVHRDIKPENVLLSGGAAVVTDFGIAKALSASRAEGAPASGGTTGVALTSAGLSIGTPAYMAPEQAVGDPSTDHRADLYAWGVMAWELLAGVHPFAHCTTPHALIAAHVRDVVPPVVQRRPDVPPHLTALVARCLEKDPALRPASAAEVLEGLDAVSTPAPAAVASRRRSMPAALVAGVVAVLAVGALAITALRSRREPPSASRVAAPTASAKSLAVLPFASVGGDTTNAYFAEGIADELTTALARLPGLRLAGRSSAARFKQRGASPQEIGSALSVGAVLDGTVRRAGDRIRVSAELSSTVDGQLLWKDSFERELKDVFAVQDDITRAIVAALQVRLADSSTNASAPRGTSNLAAYDLYLRALRRYRSRGADLLLAERELTQAIALDPGFARAHALLASVLTVMPYYFDVSVAAMRPRARAAAERAVALDPMLPEAYTALGHVQAEAFEWSAADAAFRRATALGPNNAEIAFRQGFMLLSAGRVRDALVPFERAETLDPFYSMAVVYGAWVKALVGRHDEALAGARRALELDPGNEAVNNIFGEVLSVAGRREEAVAHARRRAATTTSIRRIGFYGLVLGAGGARDDALALLRKVESMPADYPGRTSSLIRISLSLGDTTRALAALERAAAGDGDLVLSQVMNSPHFDAIRKSARFAAVLRRFNLDVERLTSPDGGRSR